MIFSLASKWQASKVDMTYRISANSFRGNYSFLNFALFTVTFDLYFINLNSCRGNYSREEIIQGRKLFAEIRYAHHITTRPTVFSNLPTALYTNDNCWRMQWVCHLVCTCVIMTYYVRRGVESTDAFVIIILKHLLSQFMNTSAAFLPLTWLWAVQKN